MSLRETFSNPSAEFRQAPFWFWNHDLDKELLSWQIEQMHEKGLGGFVMHARHGLITPYLSEDWFDCIRFCCDKAREMGMVAWAYDERDWPSGPAAGELLKAPENRMSYIRFDRETADLKNDETVVGEFAEGRAVRFECPPILWFSSYLDTLDQDACQRFIESTYDKYEHELGNLNDIGLAGFFTDEPALSTYPDDLGRIPWTDDLPAKFLECKGYDLLEQLPVLFSDAPAGKQVRHDYWDVATTLFEDAFFKQIHDWCDKRGVELIGHALGEEPLFFQFRCVGNLFYHLKHMHMPGMDHISGKVDKGSHLAMDPKIVTSAALLAGRERVSTETFGESGWALCLRDMKAMADWQLVHGINYFIPHAFYYSVAERRKKDSPPSEFYQAPYWPYYREFADYTARVSSVLTGGERVARVAMLYTMASIWTDFVPGSPDGRAPIETVEKGFTQLGEALSAAHRDFIIVDEDTFKNAKVGKTGFEVNGLPFDALVIPQTTALRQDAVDMIKQVAAVCPVVNHQNQDIALVRMGHHGQAAACETIDLSAIDGVVPLDDLSEASIHKALGDIPCDVLLDNAPDVHYIHNRSDGKEVFFFTNFAAGPVETSVSIDTIGKAELWNPLTGEAATLEGVQVDNDRLVFPLHFEQGASRLVVIDPEQTVEIVPVVSCAIAERMPLNNFWDFNPQGGNIVQLTSWDYHTKMWHKFTELRYTTRFITSEHVPNLRLILDGVPEKSYNVADAIRPMMGGETDNAIFLDGQPMTSNLPWDIDPHFRVVDLGSYCEPGPHELTIVIRNHGWFPQPGLQEYAWLAGDFRLEEVDGPPRLSPIRGVYAGPWEGQGYPHFSGIGSYHALVELPDTIDGKRVFLNAGKVGDTLEVEINGQPVGVRAWHPYRLEITDYVAPGSNYFVLNVANTARNMFERPDENHPSGLLEDVYLEIEA